MFFPRDINSIILERSPLPQLAKSVSTTRQPNSKNLFFLVSTLPIHSTRRFAAIKSQSASIAASNPLVATANTSLKRPSKKRSLRLVRVPRFLRIVCYDSVRKGLLRRNNMVMFDFFCGSGVLAAEMHSLLQRDYPYLQRRRLLKEFRHG